MNKVKLCAGLFASVGLFFVAGCDDEESVKLTVTTAEVTDISTTSATAGGSVDVANGTITERGVVWSENPSPTTSGSKAVDPSPGAGSFSILMTGLQNATEYYVRTYAIASGQTQYGNEVTFATSGPIQLIENGNFSTPAGGDAIVATAAPWKTDETNTDNIGRDAGEYKGHTGYIWTFEDAKSFYQTVGTVPAVATEYEISFDGTCSWTDWGDYKPIIFVIFSAYSGSDPSTRTVISQVDLEHPDPFPGWDSNTWGAVSDTFTLTAEQAAANAGKNLVIEFKTKADLVDGSKSGVWYNYDNISVEQQ